MKLPAERGSHRKDFQRRHCLLFDEKLKGRIGEGCDGGEREKKKENKNKKPTGLELGGSFPFPFA